MDEEYGLEGVTFGERDDPGPLRRFFMIDDRTLTANWEYPISRGLWLCIFLWLALDLLGAILYGGMILNGGIDWWTLMATPGHWLLWFLSILILVFGWYVQRWAND